MNATMKPGLPGVVWVPADALFACVPVAPG